MRGEEEGMGRGAEEEGEKEERRGDGPRCSCEHSIVGGSGQAGEGERGEEGLEGSFGGWGVIGKED